MKISGRVALITGASSGIGAATAVALAKEGAFVALAARRNDRLLALADEIEQQGGQAQVITTDMRDTRQVTKMVETAIARWGRLDILVNNAGVGYWESVLNADPDEWRREVEVNLIGPMFATRAAVPAMVEQGGGHVVNVSSLAARFAGPGWAGYAASKAGLNIFSESVLADLGERGLRVTLIETGEVATEMQSEQEQAAMPMLRAPDVADVILFALTRPAHVCVNNIQLIPNGER